jgi:hypothetical protein
MSELKACRICKSSTLIEIINLGIQPLSGVFPGPMDSASTSGPLRLLRCDACHLIQLGDTYSKDEMYGETYGYRSGLNETMISHLERVSKGLMRLLNLKSTDIVVDIGANDGTFLNFFAKSGIQAVGIDPTSSKYRQYFHSDIEIVESFFNAESYYSLKKSKAKLVTSIAMFYDLENPIQLAKDVYSILDDDGFWFLEQSYAPWMRQSGAYDTICHEHLEYYSLADIKNIMDASGFVIVRVTTNNINGGSFGVLVKKAQNRQYTEVDPYINWLQHEESRSNNLEDWKMFSNLVELRKYSLKSLVEEIIIKGHRIAGLGASTKGNVLLNYTGLTGDFIESIGEVNPYKYGRFTPGSNIPILPEAEVLESNPQYLMFLPWHFRESALERYESYLTQGGKIIFPLPNVEIIGY